MCIHNSVYPAGKRYDIEELRNSPQNLENFIVTCAKYYYLLAHHTPFRHYYVIEYIM